MIKWTPIVFVRLLLLLIAGILLHVYSGYDFRYASYWFAATAVLYVVLFAAFGRSTNAWLKGIIGFTGLLATFIFGIALTQLRTARFNPGHLLHSGQSYTHYRAIANSYVLVKPTTYKTELRLTHIRSNGQWRPASGNIQASLPKNATTAQLRYGDVLVVKGQPSLLNGPTNPGEFDYRQYLHFHNIYHQHFIREGGYALAGYQPRSRVIALAFALRMRFDNAFRTYLPGQQQYALAKALVLGIKDELDNDIRRAYASAGAMHVLAVSGLHVGIIYLVVEWLLSRVGRTRKSAYFKSGLSLLFIWLYAFVTGFSASVLRAVVMFTFISLSKLLHRRSATYNMLALSAFCMLCYNPYYIMEVGFQLSYLAVLGIVYLHPQIHRLLAFESRLASWVWTITSISVSAQLITFPLGLLYFHQFPVYFIISNLFIIPAATAILYGGLLLLWISPVSFLAYYFGLALNEAIMWMNKLIFFFEKLPYSLLTGIDISILETWLIYAAIALVLVFLAARKLRFFVMAATAVLLLSASQVAEAIRNQRQGRFTVYAIRGRTAVEMLGAKSGLFVADSSLLADRYTMQFFVWRNWWSMDAPRPALLAAGETEPALTAKLLPDGNQLVTRYGRSILLIRKPLRVSFPDEVTIDYVVLQQQALADLQTLPENLRFGALILDNSNKPWYLRKITEQSRALGLPVHAVPENGAYVDYFAISRQ